MSTWLHLLLDVCDDTFIDAFTADLILARHANLNIITRSRLSIPLSLRC